MLASDIITSARILLTDPDKVRWEDSTLLRWLNAGQRQVCAVRPDAKALRLDATLVDGVEQSIPAQGWKLLSVLHNVAADGTRGRAITLITRDELNAIDLNWPAADGRDVTRHYAVDEDNPRAFEVWPAAIAGNKVRVNIAALPADCATLESPIDLSDIYEGALVDWVCFRAYNQDSDDAQDGSLANVHLQSFMTALTGKTQADASTAPKRK